MTFQWVVLDSIVLQSKLAGGPDCAEGDLRAQWVDGVWGLPASSSDGGTMVGLPSGTATGFITATPAAGFANTIDGVFSYDVSTGSCHGTYVATLQP